MMVLLQNLFGTGTMAVADPGGGGGVRGVHLPSAIFFLLVRFSLSHRPPPLKERHPLGTIFLGGGGLVRC